MEVDGDLLGMDGYVNSRPKSLVIRRVLPKGVALRNGITNHKSLVQLYLAIGSSKI